MGSKENNGELIEVILPSGNKINVNKEYQNFIDKQSKIELIEYIKYLQFN